MAGRSIPKDILDEERRLSESGDVEGHVRRQETAVQALGHYEELTGAATANRPSSEVLDDVAHRLRAMAGATCVSILAQAADGSFTLRASAGEGNPDLEMVRQAAQAGTASSKGAVAAASGPGSRIGVVAVQPEADLDLLELAAELVGRCLERQDMVEEVEQARDSAQAGSRFKQTLLYVVTHDIKTPLTAVTLQCQILQKGLLAPEDHQGVLDRTTQHLQRLGLMLDDFLDMSRFEAGRMRLAPRHVHVPEIAADVGRLFRAQAGKDDVDIDLDAGDHRAWADENRLRQVLNNLLSNAIKYSPSGATVKVQTRQHAGGLAIDIQDDGPGMTAEQIQRLEGPFEQVLEDAVQQKGTGLGIYLSRMIAKAHGGTLTAASAGPGQGTTFTLWLPERPADDS